MRGFFLGSFLLPMLTVSILVSLLSLSAEGDSDIHYIDDDWHMYDHDVTLRNGTWWVNGSVTMDYYTLGLENATLIINNGDRSYLNIRNDAFIWCRNSTVRGTDHGAKITITQHGILENSIFYHDEQVEWDTELNHIAGNLTVTNCTFAKGYWLFDSYSNLTMMDCTFFNTSYWAVRVGYSERYKHPTSVLIENCSFQSNTGYYGGRAIVALGPGDTNFQCNVTIRNCTMREMSRPIRASNFKEEGALLIEGNIATGCDGGPEFEDVGSAVVLRYNRWEAIGVSRTGLTISITDLTTPVIHNETIISRGYGVSINGRSSTYMVLYDLTILNASVGIHVRDITLEVRNCNLSCRSYDFSTSLGNILIYDCTHSYRGYVSAFFGNITEMNHHRFTSVCWQNGISIEEGNIGFMNLSGEVVASLVHPDETSIDIPSWFVNRTYRGRYIQIIGRFYRSDVPFETEPFSTKGPSVIDLVFTDDFAPVLVVDSPVSGERLQGQSIFVNGRVTEHGSGLASVDAHLLGGEWVLALVENHGNWTASLLTLEDDIYDLEIRARDLTDNEVKIIVSDIHTDATPPSIDLLAPAQLMNVTETVLVLSIEPDAEVRVNDIVAEVDWEGICRFPVQLLEGKNTFLVLAVDTVGNENSTSFEIYRDTRVPELTVGQPADGDWVPSTEFYVFGTMDPEAMVIVNGEEAATSGETFLIPIEADEGPFTIRIVAIDRAGNVATVTLRITIDLTPPVLHINPSETGEVTSSPDYRFYGWVDDAGPVDILVNGQIVSYSEHTFNALYHLEDGANLIYIEAVDAAGNNASVVLEIRLDTTPPRIAATITIGNDSYQEGSGRILTNATGAILTLEADEECTVDIIGLGTFPLAQGGTNIDIAFKENEWKAISIEAVDKVGNSMGKVLFVVVCDTQPPKLIILWPAPGSIITSGMPSIRGSTEEGAIVEINGFPVPVNEMGFFEFKHELTSGNNSLRVTSQDAVGNVAVEELWLIYDPEESHMATFPIILLIAFAFVLSILLLHHRRKRKTNPPMEGS